MKIQFYLGVIIVIAIVGSILFFPVNIGGRYTCFYHRLVDSPQAAPKVLKADGHRYNSSDQPGNGQFSYHQSLLLENYLHKYAFIWWGSVGILALAIFIYLKKKERSELDDSGRMIKTEKGTHVNKI